VSRLNIAQFLLYRIRTGQDFESLITTCRARSIINEAAAASPKQPIVNMGQGFFGYNPPQFILNAAKQALDKVDCNQYSPTRGRPRLKKAISEAYAPLWGRKLDPETEITITTGANEGLVCPDL
jgi:kynurenine aminotransferase